MPSPTAAPNRWSRRHRLATWGLVAIAGAAVTAASVLALSRALDGSARRVVYPAAKEAGNTQVRTTRHYLIVLNVVPPEHMYPPAVAARVHPDEGELNIRGTMAPITPTARHFEAHVYSLATGKPVHGAHPTIMVVDHTAHSSEQVRVTIMQDVVVGARDYHYGNNADMAYGHRFTVTVSLAGEKAVYQVHLV